MTVNSRNIPPYDEQYFVDRKEEKDLVLDKARQLLKGETVQRRTTAFYGPRGSGKSWLICRLHQTLQDEEEFEGVTSLYLVLGRPNTTQEQITCYYTLQGFDNTTEQHPETVKEILEWVCDQLGNPITAEGLDEASAQIVERFQQMGCPLVILVDGVDEVHPSFLEPFEAYLLAPLVKEPEVLLILGGRTRDPRPGGGYTWKMPEIKLYSDEHHLLPFDEEWTRKQLDRLSENYPIVPEAAFETREAGGGYPFSNVVLAQHLAGIPPQWRNKGAALQECASTLLETVDKKLREYFWALCVLRGFDEDRMPALLATWFEDDESAWDYQRCRRIREDMVATRLARWERERGYVMDEAVRKPLENALKENQPQRWEALHEAAHKLYTEWVNRYPSAKGRWQPEADYHAKQLRGCKQGG